MSRGEFGGRRPPRLIVSSRFSLVCVPSFQSRRDGVSDAWRPALPLSILAKLNKQTHLEFLNTPHIYSPRFLRTYINKYIKRRSKMWTPRSDTFQCGSVVWKLQRLVPLLSAANVYIKFCCSQWRHFEHLGVVGFRLLLAILVTPCGPLACPKLAKTPDHTKYLHIRPFVSFFF